jgi:hypothetical protein
VGRIAGQGAIRSAVAGPRPDLRAGLLLWALPAWIGKPIAFVLSLPALYVIFLVLRAYASRGGQARMKPLHVPNGTVEALKWLALALMTGDHVNKYLFNGTLPFLFEAGRLALPIFVFVWRTTWPDRARSSAEPIPAP